ncbi:MAG TPA: hypothetical protein VLX61_00455 [Anaerolineales bacterium]|nr:hypothetical protein [Anaerolineales bacterium]
MPDDLHAKKKSHMPENSLVYEKVIPVVLILMGVLTIALILFALGILLGVIRL